jgi:GcrA cell cycle regulator
MSWSDERVDALRTLWADGLSASQIAARLGNVTRNAVIGKVHRLGIPGRATRSRPPRRAPHAAGARFTRRRPQFAFTTNPALPRLLASNGEPVPAVEELAIPLAERKYTLTLTENCCRWPIGDPKQEGFHFCGRSRLPDLPYCAFHVRRAFRPPHTRETARGRLHLDAPKAGRPSPSDLAGESLGATLALDSTWKG